MQIVFNNFVIYLKTVFLYQALLFNDSIKYIFTRHLVSLVYYSHVYYVSYFPFLRCWTYVQTKSCPYHIADKRSQTQRKQKITWNCRRYALSFGMGAILSEKKMQPETLPVILMDESLGGYHSPCGVSKAGQDLATKHKIAEADTSHQIWC